MQSAVPELVDLRGESAATKRLYGLDSDEPKKAAYARQCLLARRLVERGVRFVELTCLALQHRRRQRPNPWDQHGDLKNGHEKMALQVDQPIAALDQRPEGPRRCSTRRSSSGRASSAGRRSRKGPTAATTTRSASASSSRAAASRGARSYGATDEFGYRAVENPCDIYDLWATVLHLLGLNHLDLTYRFSGRTPPDRRPRMVLHNLIA